MMVVCVFPNCANPEKVARVIKCVGPCKGTFHIACVHVSGPNLKACQESAGISWMCADCREDREDVITSMITELAASISTSNAINAEMLTTRQSLGASTLSPDESLSTVHDRVRESLSVSLDRIFNRDNDGSGSWNTATAAAARFSAEPGQEWSLASTRIFGPTKQRNAAAAVHFVSTDPDFCCTTKPAAVRLVGAGI
uniref:(northern house mosquito) hypothetical protein n=2 Tax=Culex pipiens TaxID=7175 RepID=A0A8D8D0J5_CULPI